MQIDISKRTIFYPVLPYSYPPQPTIMSIKHKRRLQQGDRKNSFYNSTMTTNETTIIKPPIGCPFSHPDEEDPIWAAA